MDDELRVEIDLVPKPGQTVAHAIREAVLAEQYRFMPLFERLIDIDDSRVTVVEGSLQVDEPELDDGQGCIYGYFMSDFYAGCKGMNSEDEHEVELPFEVVVGRVVFQIELPKRWRVDN